MDFSKQVECDEDQTVCVVTYEGLHPEQWDRIKRNSLTLSQAGIGPQIYDIIDYPPTITYQYVQTFGWPPYHPTLTRGQIAEKAREMVRYMHEVLDIAHGDLTPDNVGYIGEQLYFIDHDELFNISEGITPWTQLLMEEDESSFEELVDSDYRRFDNW